MTNAKTNLDPDNRDHGNSGQGFVHPPLDAARMFRFVLDAMARPGTIRPVATLAAPALPLSAVAASIALTLVDYDTPVWLDDRLNQPAVVDYFRFHAGCPVTTVPGDAAFAIIGDPQNMPALQTFAQGTPEFPDRSTTLIIQADQLRDEGPVRLTGPGIETSRHLAVEPLPERVWREMQANHGRFPLGVDVLFAAPGTLAGCPRSVAIALQDAG